MTIGKGYPDSTLSEEELRQIVAASVKDMEINDKRVLIVIPDGTRTMPMALMFELLQEAIAEWAARCDYLVALGTHPHMSDEQLTKLMGKPVENGMCGRTRIFNHHWENPGHICRNRHNPRRRSRRSFGWPAIRSHHRENQQAYF